MAGHVYLIGSRKFRWYKIGMSSDARLRILNLGVLLPFKIEIVYVIRCEAYKAVERQLHVKYSEHRINGEWFHFDSDAVDAIVRDMDTLGLPVIGVSGFHNRENDLTPDGREPKIRFKSYFTIEERDRRKNEAILTNKQKRAARMAGLDLKTLEQAKVLSIRKVHS